MFMISVLTFCFKSIFKGRMAPLGQGAYCQTYDLSSSHFNQGNQDILPSGLFTGFCHTLVNSGSPPNLAVATEKGQNVGDLGRKWMIVGANGKKHCAFLLILYILTFSQWQVKTHA